MNLFTAIQVARVEIAVNRLNEDNSDKRNARLDAAYDVLAAKHAEMIKSQKDAA